MTAEEPTAAEQLAADVQAGIRGRAQFMAETLRDIHGVTYTERDWIVFETGVEAGMTATMVELSERGILPRPL